MKGILTLTRPMVVAIILSLGLLLVVPEIVSAHCDTMAGPVIQDAQAALEKGDITPVLKWVKKVKS